MVHNWTKHEIDTFEQRRLNYSKLVPQSRTESWDTRSPRLHTEMPLMDFKVNVNRVHRSTNGYHLMTTSYKDVANRSPVVAHISYKDATTILYHSYRQFKFITHKSWIVN